jgi:DNA-binding response OmpR family regulator
MFGNSYAVPQPPSLEQVRKDASVLVIDDHEFAYQGLFERDGYHIQRWPEVVNLSQLTDSSFDVILLDLHGVGLRESPEMQGLGILRSIKAANTTQLVVAYTSQEWGAKAQTFFSLADAVLAKDDEYIEFKEKVDELLLRRYTPGYFIERMNEALGDQAIRVPQAVKKATQSMQGKSTDRLKRYLSEQLNDQVTVDRVLAIISIAIAVIK